MDTEGYENKEICIYVYGWVLIFSVSEASA